MEVEAVGSAPFIIPFLRNDRYVGQESQFIKAKANLFKDKQNTPLAIVGPEGTGKLQLALKLAYRIRKRTRTAPSSRLMQATLTVFINCMHVLPKSSNFPAGTIRIQTSSGW